jgi:DNA-3-methyladenine glycosylase I
MNRISNTNQRCPWPAENELMVRYHDEEWGVPLHDDRKLFEFLVLDAFQAGLSWAIVLKKRDGFRRAFHHFDARRIAAYTEADIRRLLADKGIIRNRLKIKATIANARAFLAVKSEFGSFDRYIWQFTRGRTIDHRCRRLSDIPTTSREADAMSQDLRRRGFQFCGPTICHAFMQAAGMVNDHLVTCFRHAAIASRR